MQHVVKFFFLLKKTLESEKTLTGGFEKLWRQIQIILLHNRYSDMRDLSIQRLNVYNLTYFVLTLINKG